MKARQVLKDYFSFNRMEQRGLFVLISLLLGLLVTNSFMPEITGHSKNDFREYDRQVTAFGNSMRRLDSAELATKKQYMQKRYGRIVFSRTDTGHPVYIDKNLPVIELNTADTMDLQQLRGIGPAFARRIIKYREKLGGFSDKSQLLEIFGMDTARYNQVSKQIRVQADSVHPVSLNTVTFKQLLSHPYFPYAITRAIMIYRKDHKQFQHIEELRTIPEINDSVFGKIKGYVKIN